MIDHNPEPIAAFEFLLALAERGIAVFIQTDANLGVSPWKLVTEEDKRNLREWKPTLRIILGRGPRRDIFSVGGYLASEWLYYILLANARDYQSPVALGLLQKDERKFTDSAYLESCRLLIGCIAEQQRLGHFVTGKKLAP